MCRSTLLRCLAGLVASALIAVGVYAVSSFQHSEVQARNSVDYVAMGDAYLPYYLYALRSIDPNDPIAFAAAIADAFIWAEEKVALSQTQEITCLRPDGSTITITIAECNQLPGYVVLESSDNSSVSLPTSESSTAEGVILLATTQNIQRVKSDDELSDRERELEERFRLSGIQKQAWLEHLHDCDDFAFTGHLWLYYHGYADQVGFKVYTYINPKGEEETHCLNYVEWGDGTTTYLEPQEGEVVDLPSERTQDFESTDLYEIFDYVLHEMIREAREEYYNGC